MDEVSGRVRVLRIRGQQQPQARGHSHHEAAARLTKENLERREVKPGVSLPWSRDRFSFSALLTVCLILCAIIPGSTSWRAMLPLGVPETVSGKNTNSRFGLTGHPTRETGVVITFKYHRASAMQ